MQGNYAIVFTLNENFIGNMFVNENMLFSDIVKSFNYYYPLKSKDEERLFYFQSQPIKLDSKLKDIGLKHMSIIEIIPKKLNSNSNDNLENTPKSKCEETPGNTPKDNNNNKFMNIIFETPYKDISIQATKDTKFCDVVKKLIIKIGNFNLKPIFISNSKKIDADEFSTLEDLKLNQISRINVAFEQDLLGA